MYKQITIQTLHKQGLQKSAIARQLRCHRHTITNVLKREHVIEKQTRLKGSLFDSYQTQIREWIDTKITRLRMFEILTETYGIKSTYVNLCKYIQSHFPKQKEAFGVQVVEPGEVAEIDFGYLGMLPGAERTLIKTYGLVVVLPSSRLAYYAVTYDQKLETLCQVLADAFVYFGGVPRNLKVDNMKTAILKNQHYDLEFNQDFLEFAYHYRTVIIPCTPYSPEQKGTVESGIKYLQGNFIAGRQFVNEEDIRKQLRSWMDTYANQRVHGTTRKVPAVVFAEEEKGTLQLLPVESFSFFNRCVRIVTRNCHVHFENNYYSVPAALIEKEVTLRWNNNLVRIICAGEQVALHSKAVGVGQYVTKRQHLPDYKVYSQTEYQRRMEEQMIDIGESAHAYFQMLLTTRESYWARTVRGVLGLCESYGNEAVNLSLKRALYYKATDLTTIRNILEKKLYLVSEEPRLLGKLEDLHSTIPQQASLYRDLRYYVPGNRRGAS